MVGYELRGFLFGIRLFCLFVTAACFVWDLVWYVLVVVLFIVMV